MKILSAAQIRELDSCTIRKEPVSSIDLMERASLAFTTWFTGKFDRSRSVYVFCGPGNNGGDGFAISRLLLDRGYKVKPYAVQAQKKSEDCLVNEQRLKRHTEIFYITKEDDIPQPGDDDIVVDALFGSGLARPVSGIFASVIQRINTSGATAVAVDIASGLFCDLPNKDPNIVQPAYTVTFHLPKLSLLLPENEKYTGKLVIADIGLDPSYLKEAETKYFFTGENMIRPLIQGRSRFSHKGTFGTTLLIGGSYGMIGAVVLMSRACLRTGAGLCVTYVPECGYQILQTAVPENMVLTDKEYKFITDIPDLKKFHAIGVGPGLGKAHETVMALKKLLETTSVPLVIDADGLNILSDHPELLEKIPSGSVLTPHPKEFQRLTGPARDDYHRLELLRTFAAKVRSVVVLKGANTAVASPEGEVYFNSTGNPGMATGGSGDVLTGIITSLRGQGYSALNAALVGVYLHGFAGDRAAEQRSEPSMLASDIVEHIGDFYRKFY